MIRAAAALVLACSAALACAESMEARLLRTIQLGASQAPEAEIARFARDGERSGYLGFALAAAAMHAIGRPDAPREWPAPRILDKTLSELHRGLSFEIPPDFPARYGNEDLVFTLVYALVIGGATEQATDILEQHLADAPRYKRAVILQALRNIGTRRASQLIQKEAARGGDRNLAENLLVDLHYPFLDDLRSRLPLIPPGERNRTALARLAAEGCGVRPALAAYFLGFFPPAGDGEAEQAELALLRRLARLGCHWTRFLAIRSLALRSPESIEFWGRLYRAEKDAWQKAQLARIGYARFGLAFAPTALDWLATEPVQYVQWELMHGYLSAARGVALRDYWDIWQPPTLQFRLIFPPQERTDAGGARKWGEVLAWLEAGKRPLNDAVRNHLFYGLAREVSGDDMRRLLRALEASGERSKLWWVLYSLKDRSALPILRYWEANETDPALRRKATDVVLQLERRGPSAAQRARRSCCEATRACLAARVEDPDADAAQAITTAEQAREWLEGRAPAPRQPQIRFLDTLERVADVTDARGRSRRWAHLYGCWMSDERP